MADVLIVDDERSLSRVLARIVEGQGHAAETAGDASQALATLGRRHFDLVLCDVNLPGESGLELIAQIFDACPDTAVMMVTGVDDPALATVALEAGAYGYIIKPFRQNDIIINIENALRRRALEMENRSQREELVRMLRIRTEELWGAIGKVERGDQRLRRSFEELINRLSLAAELRDEETGAHIERMSRYAGLLARQIGLDNERSRAIRLASRMHDVGKIGVPDRILRKRGKLSAEEFATMRLHTVVGPRLFADSDNELLVIAASIAWTHHERWDGGGYPRGLAGEAIPQEGRIAAIADVFDALTSDRPYRPAFPVSEAIEMLRAEAGRHFEPGLLDAFLGSIREALALVSEHRDATRVLAPRRVARLD